MRCVLDMEIGHEVHFSNSSDDEYVGWAAQDHWDPHTSEKPRGVFKVCQDLQILTSNTSGYVVLRDTLRTKNWVWGTQNTGN